MIPILIGSGVSCAGDLPSVDQLSEQAASHFIGTPREPLFKALKGLCDEDRNGAASNYEDWLYLATQVRDHVHREYENPGLIPLIADLNSKTELAPKIIQKACEEIIISILHVVCGELSSSDEQAAKAFIALDSALESHSSKKVRFFSLNHDLLLEKYLKKTGLVFYDGFAPIDGVDHGRRFDFNRQGFETSAVALLKLHGSINWWRHRPTRARNADNPWIYEFIGVEMGKNRVFEQMDETPLILAGTFNKILQYSSPVFLQLLGEFHNTLQCADRLAVCGYGFADKGINSLIANWMSSSMEHHLFVFDPKPFDAERARGAILGKIEAWENEGRIHTTPKRIGSEIDWDKLFDTVFAPLA
ncbi:MAG: SIR2 family protein [Verrucomicrobia bacterium]|nr:SIR2 family protein [Verrucomicrobiota bacterium]